MLIDRLIAKNKFNEYIETQENWIYIIGKSGIGKSYFIRSVTKYYKTLYCEPNHYEYWREMLKKISQYSNDIIKDLIKDNSIELPKVKLMVTGAGRVSQGAQHVLENIGAQRMTEETYLATDKVDKLSYCVADVDRLVKRKDGGAFAWNDFTHNAMAYESDFMRFAKKTDVLICAHFWGPDAPVYLSEDDLRNPDMRIRMIGDVTCDIKGSIKSTVRPATHDAPYYDYNPVSEQDESAFSSKKNITVMAVDTCPNALAMDTSTYFGDMLMRHVFEPLLKGEYSDVISRSMILDDGELTPRFDYLYEFAHGKK